MFTNAIRVQARAALSSCRARVSITSVAAQVVARRPTQSLLAVSRPLSTSRAVRFEYGSETSFQPPPRRNEPSKTLYVGNLPFSIEESEVREKFESFGDIQAVRVAVQPDGTGRGFAHVEYSTVEEAQAAFQSFAEEPLYILNRDIRVDFAPSRPKAPPREQSHKLFFQDFHSDEVALRDALKDFESNIIDVFFLKHPETRELTGKGFIEFGSVSQATEALNQLGKPESGLNLNYARPPKPKSNDTGRRASYGGDWGGSRRNTGGGSRDGYSGNRRGGGGGGGGRDGGRGRGDGGW